MDVSVNKKCRLVGHSEQQNAHDSQEQRCLNELITKLSVFTVSIVLSLPFHINFRNDYPMFPTTT